MLKIDNLTITTHTGRKLLDSFSFVLNDNDKIALIGEEGNGKSTILKIIAGIDISDYVTYTGNIYCDQSIAYLPQTIHQNELDKTILEYISDDIDYGLLYEILGKINIDYFLIEDNRLLKTLSGGEKVKVSIIKLMYSNADILLLDEPSNDLDLETIIWLEEFIKQIDNPMIFISHDETLLENCANGILHLEQLKRKSETHMTYSGLDYRSYCEDRNLFIQRTNMIASKQRFEYKKQLDKWRQIYQKVEHRQNTISRGDPHGGQLLKKKMKAVKSQGRNLDRKRENFIDKYEPEEAIDIFFKEFDINPNKVILDLNIDELKIDNKVLSKNIELYVKASDKICIIGSNGTGKTTLLRYIYNSLKDRDDIKVGYMSQNYSEVMNYDITPVDFLWDKESYETKSKIQTYLGSLKFTAEEMNHKISDLSEGQKCKIILLKLILDECDVLLLDEPSRNLSPLSNPVIRNMLNDYKGCIISVSHDRKFIDEVADKIYELKKENLSIVQ